MECRRAEKSSGRTKISGSSNAIRKQSRPWNSLSSAPIRKTAPPYERPSMSASADGKDFDLEYRLLMPDGSVKYVHAVARATRDASGQHRVSRGGDGCYGGKEAERKLRRSEAYLAETQHLSHTSSWAWDVRGREFVYQSAEMYHLFGFDPEKGAVPLQAFRDRIVPEDRRRNIEAASRAIREKADFEVEFRIALPDGRDKIRPFRGTSRRSIATVK